MFIFNQLKRVNINYPLLIGNKFLKEDKYKELKNNWPNFRDYKTINAGQTYRKNIEIIEGNANYQKLDKKYKELFDQLNSQNFRKKIAKEIDWEILKKTYGYIGDFLNSQLQMHIAECTTNYENPWHVDKRSRIIHFILYFGDDQIIEGGQLGIGWSDKQTKYIKEDELQKKEYIELSTNNSFHKGCKLVGKRRFIYGAYTNRKGNAWKLENFKNAEEDFQKALTKY